MPDPTTRPAPAPAARSWPLTPRPAARSVDELVAGATGRDPFHAADGKSAYGRMTECFTALFGPYKEDLTTGAYGSWTRKWFSGPRVRVVAALVVDSAEEAMITW